MSLETIQKTMPNIETLNLDTLSILKEAMEDDFIELLPAFFESTLQIIADLRQAQSTQQFEILQRNAHSLKSSSASLGAMKLSSLAKSMEQQCINKVAVEIQQIGAIENEYACVEQALTAFSKL